MTRGSVRLRSVCLVAALAAAAAAHLVAQQPTFKSSVEVLLVDVTVVDRLAFPVRDLPGAADFAVTVDGKSRTIVSAQIPHRAPGIDDVLRVEAGMPPASALESDRVGAGREAHHRGRRGQPRGGRRTRRQDGGRAVPRPAGVVRPGRRRRDPPPACTPPRPLGNRVELFRAVERINPGIVRTKGKDNIGLYEAFAIEQRDGVTTENVLDRECDPERITGAQALEACRVDVFTEGKQPANMGHDCGQRAVDAIRRLAELLASIPRPKTLVLISGGFPTVIEHTRVHQRRLGPGAGQVNLDTISSCRATTSRRCWASTSPTQVEDEGLERQGIENMTSAAGGTLLEVTGDFEPALNRVSREISASIFWRCEVSAADRDGRPHRVDVKVNRKDVQIRLRRHYVIAKPLPSGAVRAEAERDVRVDAGAERCLRRRARPAALQSHPHRGAGPRRDGGCLPQGEGGGTRRRGDWRHVKCVWTRASTR